MHERSFAFVLGGSHTGTEKITFSSVCDGTVTCRSLFASFPLCENREALTRTLRASVKETLCKK